MKETLGALMDKIVDIENTICELEDLPEHFARTKAVDYLEEYVCMLKDIKVDL